MTMKEIHELMHSEIRRGRQTLSDVYGGYDGWHTSDFKVQREEDIAYETDQQEFLSATLDRWGDRKIA